MITKPKNHRCSVNSSEFACNVGCPIWFFRIGLFAGVWDRRQLDDVRFGPWSRYDRCALSANGLCSCVICGGEPWPSLLEWPFEWLLLDRNQELKPVDIRSGRACSCEALLSFHDARWSVL